MLITLSFLVSFKAAITIYKIKSKFLSMVYIFSLPFQCPLLLLSPYTFLFQALHAAWLIFVYVFVHVLLSLPETACQKHPPKDTIFSFEDPGLKCLFLITFLILFLNFLTRQNWLLPLVAAIQTYVALILYMSTFFLHTI